MYVNCTVKFLCSLVSYSYFKRAEKGYCSEKRSLYMTATLLLPVFSHLGNFYNKQYSSIHFIAVFVHGTLKCTFCAENNSFCTWHSQVYILCCMWHCTWDSQAYICAVSSSIPNLWYNNPSTYSGTLVYSCKRQSH